MLIGLDIGGTKIIACAADLDGNILAQVQQPTPAGLEEGLALVHRLVQEVRGEGPIAAIGVSAGGPLNWRSGVISPLHQPAWKNVPLKALLEQRWGCECVIDVDTNLAALGEYAACDPKPERLLYITISTGMGGGLLINGEIYRGAGGAHPEIAHQAVPHRCRYPDRVSCECGLPDCLEGLVSGNAIRRIYGKPAEDLDESEWEEISHNLGQGLRNLAAVLAPDLIVLGGGVAIGRGEALIESAGDVMRQRLRIVPAPELRLSVLGYYTPLHGAVEVARRRAHGTVAF